MGFYVTIGEETSCLVEGECEAKIYITEVEFTWSFAGFISLYFFICLEICSDSTVSGSEGCDDGNTENGKHYLLRI